MNLLCIDDPGLVSASFGNMFEAFHQFARYAPGAEILDTPQILRYYTGVGHPFGNAVIRATLDPASAERDVAQTLSYYKSKGVPAAWFVCAASGPPNLEELLERAGAVRRSTSPVMAADLRTLPAAAPLPSEAQVREVDGPELADAWGHVAAEGSDVPHELGEFIANALHAQGYGSGSNLRCFLATVGGTPAATSMLVLAEGLAGLYTVATLPAFRRRGLGYAVSHRALAAAAAAGYPTGTLQASRMGRPTYERLGFREIASVTTFTYNTPA